ncbi:hypothetical protein pb186bvf_009195 [Paramecium bursaria]
MINTRQELLQWAKRFAPLRMVQDQNFSDGVCFAMILKGVHSSFPQLNPQVMIDYKIKNLETLKAYMRQYEVNIDFDINKIARRDQQASLLLIQELRHYWMLNQVKQDADKKQQQPDKRLSMIPVTSQLVSKKLEPVQGLPITFTPSSQSQQYQPHHLVNYQPELPKLDRLEKVENRSLLRSPSQSQSPSPFTTPARKLCTPKIVNTYPEQFEEKERSDNRNTYATSQGLSQRQSQIYSPIESPNQCSRWSPHGNQSRSRATIENQQPQYTFTTPIQNKFKQSVMQQSYSCSIAEKWLQMPKAQINQFNNQSQPYSYINTLNANQSTPHFGNVQLDQSSKALIDEFNQIQTSNNKQVQKESIRKILRNIILDGKSLHTAQLQIQIIDAISGPEDQDLIEYKQWLQGQLQQQNNQGQLQQQIHQGQLQQQIHQGQLPSQIHQGQQQSQIPQGFITQDQATQYHSIDSDGFYAQSSQVIPRTQDYIVPQQNQFQFSPQQLIQQQRISQGQLMVQEQMMIQEQMGAIQQRMSQSQQFMIPQEQMIIQEQRLSQSQQYMMPQEQIMAQEQMIPLEQIPIEQRNYSQSVTQSTAANTQNQSQIQSQIQQSQNHLIFSQSTLPNSQSQNQIYSQNNQQIQQGSQGYDGQNH